jgi:translation initiation factor IF-1
MSYTIAGSIVGHKGDIPIVSDSSIKKASKTKGKVTYKKVSPEKLKGIQKKTKKVGEKGEKLSGYQIFNAAIKERKSKDKTFTLPMEEKKEKWAQISAKIAKGKIKATKKDIGSIVKTF